MTRAVLFATISLAASLSFADAPKKVHAGQWEFSTTREMEGMPAQPPMVTQRCITADEAADPAKNQKAPEGCELMDVKNNGNKVTWNVSCHIRGGVQTGTGEVTYSGDSMTTTNTIHIDDPRIGKRTMTNRTLGHRLGECAK